MMKMLPWYAILLFTGFLASCSDPSDNLDDFLENRMRRAGVPGMAVGVMRDGELAWTGTYGFADLDRREPVSPDTRFMIASISKTVTATAVMTMVENGMIGLDNPIDDYLPFPVRNPAFPDRAITVRMLLAHVSSIRDEWDVLYSLYTIEDGGGDSSLELKEFIEMYLHPDGPHYDAQKNFYTDSPPGTAHRYGNVNYALLGLIVERRSGQAFDNYCYETIFRPLGMDSTSWFLSGLDPRTIAIPYKVTKEGTEAIPHYGYPDYPDGQIRTTVEDLARFTSLYLNRGVAAGARILEARTVEEILEVQYPDVNPNQAIAWNYDEFHHFLVRIFLGAKPAHTGGDPGVSTILVTDPETRSAVIVLMNGMAPGVLAQKAIYIDVLRRLCREAGINR